MPENEEVGSLFFGITLDTEEFKQALKDVKATVKNVGNEIVSGFKTIAKGFAVVSAGIAAGIAGLLGFAAASNEATKAQVILAESIGATQAQIAGLELASEKLGVETSMVIDKMREFGGIEEFSKLADEVKGAGSETEQLAKAVELFGGEGAKILPILQQGSAGLKDMEEEARRLGLALSPEQIEQSRVVWEQFEDTLQTIKGLGKQIGAAFLKPLGLMTSAVKAFVETFREDILSGFQSLSEVITNFIKGAIDKFIEFGIPFINGFISFAGQIGDAFQTLFDFLSPATDSAAAGFGALFKGLTEFLATFKQQLTLFIAAPIEAVLQGVFKGLAKLSEFVGDVILGITAGLAEVGAIDAENIQAVSDAFLEQRLAILKQGKQLAEPFRQAQENAVDEMADIFAELDEKNRKQQDRFKGIVGEFSVNFQKATEGASEAAKETAAAIEKNVAVSEKFSGLILSGSQEEFRVINQTRNKELDELIKTRKANEEQAKTLKKLETF